MSRPKAVITHWVHDEVIDYLADYCDIVINTGRESFEHDALMEHLEDADAVMVFMPDSIDGGFLDRCPNLRVVSAALKGFDNFDVTACTRRGIWFTNVPDLLTIPTAELAIGHLIAVGRNMAAGDRLVRSGWFKGWRPVLYGQGLAGSTVGILGMGAVGQAIAERLVPFSATVLYHDRQRLPSHREADLNCRLFPLEDIYHRSDFIVVALPLSDETANIIDEEAISKMKHGSYLINVGRGSSVVEPAVRSALAEGRLAGFGTDVFCFEDWLRPGRRQSIDTGLLELTDSTFFTPHLGSAVEQVRLNIAMDAAVNIVEVLQGRRPHGAVNNIG